MSNDHIHTLWHVRSNTGILVFCIAEEDITYATQYVVQEGICLLDAQVLHLYLFT